MIVVYELVKMLAEFLATHLGVEGIAIGGLAAVVVGLWYLREAADVFVVLARYARIGSLIGFALLVVLIAGSVTGYIEIDSGGSLVGQFVNQISEVLH